MAYANFTMPRRKFDLKLLLYCFVHLRETFRYNSALKKARIYFANCPTATVMCVSSGRGKVIHHFYKRGNKWQRK